MKMKSCILEVILAVTVVTALSIHDDITFDLIDIDRNGKITLKEVNELSSGREGAEALFVFVDKDGGGFVDEYEFSLFKEQLEEYLSRKNTSRTGTSNLRIK